MSNFYIDHEATQKACDIIAYHRFCAPVELKAQGDQPCCLDEFSDSRVYCAECKEVLNDLVKENA